MYVHITEIYTVTCDARRGFGLDIEFIDHLTKSCSFPARSVFTSSSLLTVSNNGYSSASGLKSSLTADQFQRTILASTVLFITSLHGPSRKHRFQQYLHCCMRICCRWNVLIESLPRKGSGIFAYLVVVA
jgi:hypothetical protein